MDTVILRKAVVDRVSTFDEMVHVVIKNNMDEDNSNSTIKSYSALINGVIQEVKPKFEDEAVQKLKEASEDDECWALPLFPMIVHVMPKVGEAVYIFTPPIGNNNTEGLKYYIGPIISLPSHLNKDDSLTALANDMSSKIARDTSPSSLSEWKGCYPQTDDVAIMGRKNSELVLVDDGAVLRTDSRHYDATNDKNHISYNKSNPSYIQLKSAEGMDPMVGSTATIVADNINLIGHKGLTVADPVTDTAMLPTGSKKLEEIIEKAHKLPYGDVLVEILQEIIQVLATHIHPYVAVPPDPTSDLVSLQTKSQTLEADLLSENIRIN